MGKQKRSCYSDEFKTEPLKLAERTSVTSAAREMGIHELQIYGWCSAVKKKANVVERESELLVENVWHKRQMAEYEEELAILKKSATYFARNQK